MRANLPDRTTVEKANDSVIVIDELIASEANDEETLDALDRNARHLEIVIANETLSSAQRKAFQSAIDKAKALVE